MIKNIAHLQRQKLKKKPPFNKFRKETLIDFAPTHMTYPKIRRIATPSNKMKFNLEGSDGYFYYYHELHKEGNLLDRLHSRVGGGIV